MAFRDIWESYFDRPLNPIGDKGKRIPHAVGNIAYVGINVICKVAFRFKVEGRENIRQFDGKSGALIIANHTSYLELAAFFIAPRWKQWSRFIARDSLFEVNPLGSFIIASAGAIPIARNTADTKSIKRAVRCLKDGELLMVFPEGTRRGKGSLEPSIHSGAMLMARMAKVPIVPATCRNSDKVKIKGDPRIHFPKIVVEYGKPYSLSEFSWVPKRDRLDAAAWYLMRECYALAYQCPAEDVDMVSLFPENKDFTQLFAEHGPIPHYILPDEQDDAVSTKDAS